MPRTIDQQIAETVNKLQRLKTKKRTKDTRRKIIVGAVITAAAFKDRGLAQISKVLFGMQHGACPMLKG